MDCAAEPRTSRSPSPTLALIKNDTGSAVKLNIGLHTFTLEPGFSLNLRAKPLMLHVGELAEVTLLDSGTRYKFVVEPSNQWNIKAGAKGLPYIQEQSLLFPDVTKRIETRYQTVICDPVWGD
jgi:hypothetical protein